jgi:integrase
MGLMECVSLQVKDVDFGRRDIIIRQGKGFKNRVTMLPLALAAIIKEQIALAHALNVFSYADVQKIYVTI